MCPHFFEVFLIYVVAEILDLQRHIVLEVGHAAWSLFFSACADGMVANKVLEDRILVGLLYGHHEAAPGAVVQVGVLVQIQYSADEAFVQRTEDDQC